MMRQTQPLSQCNLHDRDEHGYNLHFRDVEAAALDPPQFVERSLRGSRCKDAHLGRVHFDVTRAHTCHWTQAAERTGSDPVRVRVCVWGLRQWRAVHVVFAHSCAAGRNVHSGEHDQITYRQIVNVRYDTWEDGKKINSPTNLQSSPMHHPVSQRREAPGSGRKAVAAAEDRFS